MSIGLEVRLRRLLPPGGRRLFAVPMDHTVSMGPISGLEDLRAAAAALVRAGADLLIVTKGAVRQVAPELGPSTYLGVHLSASTELSPSPDRKIRVGSAGEAVRLGADLLSVQVNFGVEGEGAMLADLGAAVEEAHALGLPVLCMTYVKGARAASPSELQHAARAAADLGAGVVKVPYPGSPEALAALVRTTPVPVLLGGGLRLDDEHAALERIRRALDAGIAGLCAGRNLFQREPVGPFARAVADLVHGARSGPS
ncbi:MAG: fructose-bisphosphate aldolase [Thermoplasmata archaeon]|nr:fructose-bisphosphate aldolase [Thermoplasmata archaeon]